MELEGYVKAHFATEYEQTRERDRWPFSLLFDSRRSGRIIFSSTVWGLATNFRWMSRLRATDHVIVTSAACILPGEGRRWSAYLSELERYGQGIRKENVYLLCNSRVEHTRALDDGFENAQWVHHNCFLDPRVLFIRPAVPKMYDAVYTGRILPYKRHHLASQVKNAYALRYPTDPEKPPSFYADSNSRWLTPDEVCEVLNRARVGLILSELEGGNNATTEYLLCGLPVVSTRIQALGTLGGREEYLDDDNCVYCDPMPEAVKAAVDELCRHPRDPYRIRQRAIDVSEVFIERFIGLLGEILGKIRDPVHPRSLYSRIFSHKMGMTWQPLAQILKQIE
jgi:glycosyltransferase involved in cell wall biosynthesis